MVLSFSAIIIITVKFVSIRENLAISRYPKNKQFIIIGFKKVDLTLYRLASEVLVELSADPKKHVLV